MSDKFDQERWYKEGYTAQSAGEPKSSNPYAGKDDEQELYWDRGWDRGDSGKDYDGYE